MPRRSLAFLGSAAIVLAACAAQTTLPPPASRSPVGSPSPSSSPGATPTTAVVETPTSLPGCPITPAAGSGGQAPGAVRGPLVWTRGAGRPNYIHVAYGPHGFVGVGLDKSDWRPWISADGKTFERAAFSADLVGTELVAVAGGSAGYVAAGDGTHKLLFSPDGRHWKAIIDPVEKQAGQFRDVASDGRTFVAVGFASDRVPKAWRSLDGLVWKPVEGSSSDYSLELVAAGPGGYLLLGQATGTYEWAAWTLGDSGYRMVPAPKVQGTLWGLAGGDLGFVAIGPGETWFCAADGGGWVSGGSLVVGEGGSAGGIVAVAGGFVAVGGDGTQAASWVTTDGTNWMLQPEGPNLGAGSFVSVAAGPGRLVTTGGWSTPLASP